MNGRHRSCLPPVWVEDRGDSRFFLPGGRFYYPGEPLTGRCTGQTAKVLIAHPPLSSW